MELLLLTARPDLDTNERFRAAATRLGVTLVVADATRTVAGVGVGPRLLLEGRNLLERVPEAALARVGNWRPDSVLAALEVATAAGARTPNPAEAIRSGRDHWRTLSLLADAGLPVPPTLAGADPEELAATAVRELGLPVVVKQRRSRMGVGVIRCDGRDHLEAVLDSLWRAGDEFVVQRFVPTDGVSLRLLVTGHRVVAAARFVACDGDWRSNAARGGAAGPYQPTTVESELALAAAERLSLGVCGVDLLPAAGSTLVGEVNPTPGFRHLEHATGIDVAGAIIAAAVGQSAS